MKRYALVGAVVALAGLFAGCGAAPIQIVKVPVPVPVPVECRMEMPIRPAMLTETLSAGVELDRFSPSALAEIELREGYEGELRAALEGRMWPPAR